MRPALMYSAAKKRRERKAISVNYFIKTESLLQEIAG
jgi:hypothetical protein